MQPSQPVFKVNEMNEKNPSTYICATNSQYFVELSQHYRLTNSVQLTCSNNFSKLQTNRDLFGIFATEIVFIFTYGKLEQ